MNTEAVDRKRCPAAHSDALWQQLCTVVRQHPQLFADNSARRAHQAAVFRNDFISSQCTIATATIAIRASPLPKPHLPAHGPQRLPRQRVARAAMLFRLTRPIPA